MKIEFSNKDLAYLYNTLLENLEKLEEHKTLNRQDIKKLISILESASPELKDIKALRCRYQDQKNQSQKA